MPAQKPQNINGIANIMLAKGWNKNAIIGILCNMGKESGWNHDADEKPYLNGYFESYHPNATNHGYGLVQYSFKPIAQLIWDKNHSGCSEWESIRWQIDNMENEWGYNIQNGASFQYNGPYYYKSIGDYFHNTKGLSDKQCTIAWVCQFEKPLYGGVEAGISRYNEFINTVNANVKWDGNIPEGGGSVSPPEQPEQPEQPEETKPRKLTLQECLSFLDKIRPTHNGTTQPDPIDPDNPTPNPPPVADGSGSSRVWTLYNEGVANNLHYWSAHPDGFPKWTDCSGFVSRALRAYWGQDWDGNFYNTDQLHAHLRGLGYKCTYQGARTGFPNSAPAGSVILMGVEGQSFGSNGHTVFVVDNNVTLECAWSAPPNQNQGLGQSTVSALKNWHYLINYWYLYTPPS